jgi:hypothetical protein
MKIVFGFDELTSPRDAGQALIAGAYGNLEHDNENQKLSFVAADFTELEIALKKVKPYIKSEHIKVEK